MERRWSGNYHVQKQGQAQHRISSMGRENEANFTPAIFMVDDKIREQRAYFPAEKFNHDPPTLLQGQVRNRYGKQAAKYPRLTRICRDNSQR